MTRRRMFSILTGLAVVLIAAVSVWWFGFGQSQNESAGLGTPRVSEPSQVEAERKSVVDAAIRLATSLTSADQTTYEDAWVPGSNVPPMAPTGTTIKIDDTSFQSYETFRRVEAVMTVPDKNPTRIIIYLAPVSSAEKWRVIHVEEVK